MRFLLTAIGALVLVTIGGPSAMAQVQVRCWVVAGGVTDAVAGETRLLGTSGEPIVGFSALGSQALTHGVWRAGRTSLVVDAPASGRHLPEHLAFEGANPNPFRESTQLAFALPTATSLALRIYDMQGRLVTTLAEGSWDAGVHRIALRDPALGNGVFFARLETGGVTITRKLVHLR